MTTANTTPAISQVDVRGPRFSAWVTTTVLIITLAVSAVSPTAAAVILGLQAVVFAIGALLGPHRAPYGTIFRTLIQPRLSPVTEREPVPRCSSRSCWASPSPPSAPSGLPRASHCSV